MPLPQDRRGRHRAGHVMGCAQNGGDQPTPGALTVLGGGGGLGLGPSGITGGGGGGARRSRNEVDGAIHPVHRPCSSPHLRTDGGPSALGAGPQKGHSLYRGNDLRLLRFWTGGLVGGHAGVAGQGLGAGGGGRGMADEGSWAQGHCPGPTKRMGLGDSPAPRRTTARALGLLPDRSSMAADGGRSRHPRACDPRCPLRGGGCWCSECGRAPPKMY